MTIRSEVLLSTLADGSDPFALIDTTDGRRLLVLSCYLTPAGDESGVTLLYGLGGLFGPVVMHASGNVYLGATYPFRPFVMEAERFLSVSGSGDGDAWYISGLSLGT